MTDQDATDGLFGILDYVQRFDRNGQTLTWAQWTELRYDWAYRRLAESTTRSRHFVSTVWLGLNHSFEDGPPLIFETMVFDLYRNTVDMCRWATEQEARIGHVCFFARWSKHRRMSRKRKRRAMRAAR